MTIPGKKKPAGAGFFHQAKLMTVDALGHTSQVDIGY